MSQAFAGVRAGVTRTATRPASISRFVFRVVFATALAMAALGVCATNVRAQARDGVVVTATRFSDSSLERPIDVTVISADDIRRSATSNLPEILSQFGLLHIRDDAGSPNQQIDMRGFGITGDQNTLVLVDGVRLSENEQTTAQLNAIPIDSIDRIEILRGSGAVLYGGGATGGTINIITRTPLPGESRSQLLGRTGGYGTKELRAGYSRFGDIFGASIAFSSESTAGYRKNNQFDQTNLALGLDARGSDGRAYLRFGVDDQKLRLPGSLTEAQIQADRRQTLNPNDRSARDGVSAVLGGSWAWGKNEAGADLAYRDKHAIAAFPGFFFFVDTKASQRSFTPRAKLNFPALGRSQSITLGLDWQDWKYVSKSAASQATLSAPFSHRVGEQSNVALYALADLSVADATRLVLGARTQRTRERLAEQAFPISDRREARNLMANEAALSQSFGGGWSGYAKYARSFRVANFDDNACFFPPCAATLLDPQIANGIEGGVGWERGDWRLKAAVYEMRLKNEIYFSPLAGSNINLSPTRRRGIELQGDWSATRNLDLRAGIAWQQAKFRSGVYGGVDVSGKDIPLVPGSIASASASWRFADKTRLNVNLRYVGAQRYDNDQANTFGRTQPDYTVVDMKLEHKLERVDLALEAKNLLNKKYFSTGRVDLFGPTVFSAFPAPERAIYASAGIRFD